MESRALKDFAFGGILTATSLLVGEFWKDAIQQTVYSLVPKQEVKKRMWIAYAIAIGFTILSFSALYLIYTYFVQ